MLDLEKHGLFVLGTFFKDEQTTFLIGNGGRSLSLFFERDYSSKTDPLDQWSKEIIEPIAKKYNGKVLYPFDGPDYLPFVQWGIESGELFESPLGILIHPKYGLWHGFRGAIVLEGNHLPVRELVESPCSSCVDRACLSACRAFSLAGFSRELCLEQMKNRSCLKIGCQARNSCPVGDEHRYSNKQLAFHMRALYDFEY